MIPVDRVTDARLQHAIFQVLYDEGLNFDSASLVPRVADAVRDVLDPSASTFQLHRDTDVSGVSGTGIVADGVVFPDGTVAVRWRGDRQSTVFWASIEDVEAVHGHKGATRIVWAGAA